MKKVRTQIQSHFANAVHANIRRSTFLRNYTRKTTFNCGELVPISLDEILPGDTFEMDLSFVSRLSTPIFPTMDVLNLEFFAFFVPNRLCWKGWEELFGENKTSAWVPPVKPALVPSYSGRATSGSVGDHYGLPLNVYGQHYGGQSVIPFRGYALIWNDFFRDQNLQAPLIVGNDRGQSTESILPHSPMLKVNKKHDFFTACLPAPQKGESALIPIELNDLIPIIRTGTGGSEILVSGNTGNTISTGGTNANVNYGTFDVNQGSGLNVNGEPALLSLIRLFADARGLQINATTISELRTAFQVQKLYERDARAGSRYIEMLKVHYGVDAQDYRLQRPEFLGRAHSYVGMQQVPQMSSTDSTSPQGNMAAYSYTSGSKHLFKKSFSEHGYLHIFVVVRQPKTYQQGVEKHWTRRDRLDFYHPVFAHISEQPVYNKEIYADTNTQVNNEVFGYNEAWAEYRYKPNSVAGQFRSDAPNKLDNWHYADWYTSRPFLSASWIQENSKENVDRTLAVPSSVHDQVLMDIAFKCKATRPMPVHSIPGLVDHF